ncbi:MAG TPA: V-type ATP synthase subunit B [Xanthobacteraceae bacterium]|nr:V-type ATP synthase subunit B [Xanthobacteraceae bacterium]
MRPELLVQGTATAIEGPLLFLRRNVEAGLNEAVEILSESAPPKLGRVAALDQDAMVIEVLESTIGLGLRDIRIRFLAEPLHFAVGPGLLGRIFNGVGEPVDGGAPVAARKRLRIDGVPINPTARELPRDFIETGITAIDLMNSLIRGQKLPLFSAGGMPHDRIASDIAQHARLRRAGEAAFAVVFVGIGISHDVAETFRRAMQESGALAHTALFVNLASESSTQRLLTPRFALTAAEYLAADEGRHVLVIMTDMTNYCEALREVSASHGEVPSRKGYPGYMYSDLATIYERAGVVRGAQGTITQLPILTMPADDITHPIPDLTGYITEGQLVLDHTLDRKGVFPPINVLPSLSRLMDQGIGKGYSHPDHPGLANQLYASYAKAVRVRVLASVVGRDGLTPLDLQYLEFADQFETSLIAQSSRRTLEQSMAAGWAVLRRLPNNELTRLSDAQIAHYIEPLAAPERSSAHA